MKIRTEQYRLGMMETQCIFFIIIYKLRFADDAIKSFSGRQCLFLECINFKSKKHLRTTTEGHQPKIHHGLWTSKFIKSNIFN